MRSESVHRTHTLLSWNSLLMTCPHQAAAYFGAELVGSRCRAQLLALATTRILPIHRPINSIDSTLLNENQDTRVHPGYFGARRVSPCTLCVCAVAPRVRCCRMKHVTTINNWNFKHGNISSKRTSFCYCNYVQFSNPLTRLLWIISSTLLWLIIHSNCVEKLLFINFINACDRISSISLMKLMKHFRVILRKFWYTIICFQKKVRALFIDFIKK